MTGLMSARQHDGPVRALGQNHRRQDETDQQRRIARDQPAAVKRSSGSKSAKIEQPGDALQRPQRYERLQRAVIEDRLRRIGGGQQQGNDEKS